MYSYEVCTTKREGLEKLCAQYNVITIKEGLCDIIQGSLKDLQEIHDVLFASEIFDPIKLY